MKDIEHIGKRLPYEVADDSLDRMTDQLFVRIQKHVAQRSIKRKMVRLVGLDSVAVLVMALAVAIYLHQPKAAVGNEYEINKVLQSLSDEEVCQLEAIATADQFNI